MQDLYFPKIFGYNQESLPVEYPLKGSYDIPLMFLLYCEIEVLVR